jgi:hypothetical protein
MRRIFPCPVRVPPLASSRTAKYIAAMIQEGDSFDYNKWLKRVCEEEAEAKRVDAAGVSGELVAAQIANPIKTSDRQLARTSPALSSIPKTLLRTRRRHQEAQSKTAKARLRRWLERVRGALEDFQSNRRRDGVYGYLEAVFAIVEAYRVRRRTKKLFRQVFKFADLPFDKNANPFTAVIRCTSNDGVYNKTINKWARALRYVARSKVAPAQLKAFRIWESAGVRAQVTPLGSKLRKTLGMRFPPMPVWPITNEKQQKRNF